MTARAALQEASGESWVDDDDEFFPGIVFPSREAFGLELRNNLKRPSECRRASGAPLIEFAWARAVAYVTSLLDAEITVSAVSRHAERVGVSLDPSVILKVTREMDSAHRDGTLTVSARDLGDLLMLTRDERASLGIRRIDSYEEPSLARKKRLSKEREARRRIEKLGAKPRAQSIEAAKPWVAEGISRRTWYRRRSGTEKPRLPINNRTVTGCHGPVPVSGDRHETVPSPVSPRSVK